MSSAIVTEQEASEAILGLPEALREHYEYRAGVLEFDAGFTREIAERLAMDEVLAKAARSRTR